MRAIVRVGRIVNPNENGAAQEPDLAVTQPYLASTSSAPQTPQDPAFLGTRFLLWVDAVGGYLVCLENEIEIGQAVPNNSIHLPIIADLSRQHARICREGESYLLKPIAAVELNGETIESTALLADNDLIQMGAVKLRYRQPHALSATARLDFESRHRTKPSADGVLLFAESCVLGPGGNNHVVCRDWEQDVVMFRQDDRLCCRATAPILVDGRKCDRRAELQLDSRISGEDFSMSLEPL